jgi:hypothetical protein
VSQICRLYPVSLELLLAHRVPIVLAPARARSTAWTGWAATAILPWDVPAGPAAPPPRAANFGNEVWLPGGVCGVVAFALITSAAHRALVALARLFLATRLVHATMHARRNDVRWRLAVALGWLMEMILWPKLARNVAMAGPPLPAHLA